MQNNKKFKPSVQYAPRYAVTCGGMDDVSWCMNLKEVKTKVKELRETWTGSGVFPKISVMKTTIIFQKEVDMEF